MHPRTSQRPKTCTTVTLNLWRRYSLAVANRSGSALLACTLESLPRNEMPARQGEGVVCAAVVILLIVEHLATMSELFVTGVDGLAASSTARLLG